MRRPAILIFVVASVVGGAGIFFSLRSHSRFTALHDPDPRVREDAIRHLWVENCLHPGPESKAASAAPELTGCLNDPDADVRAQAILLLNNVGTAAVPVLTQVLSTGDKQARISALQACGLPDPRYPRQFSSADDRLLLTGVSQCLMDPDDQIRAAATAVVIWVSRGANEEQQGINLLCSSLTDQSEYVRDAAATGLARFGKLARLPSLLESAIVPLANSLFDQSEVVRKSAQWALEEIGKRLQERKIGAEGAEKMYR